MRYSLILMAFLAQACASVPDHGLADVQTKDIEVKGHTVDDGEIGIDGKGRAVVQVQKTVENELRVQDMVNTHLMDEARDQMWHLKDCRERTADPALGGSGNVEPLPDEVSLARASVQIEQMGLDEGGEIKLVTREFLDKRLASERQLEGTIRAVIKVATPMREECERKLSYKERALKSTEVVSETTTRSKTVGK
jgi:hypothetical protein